MKKNTKKIEKVKDEKLKLCENEDKCLAITFLEQKKIIKEITDKRYLDFFIFCCCTGVRVCEAFSIKVSDIDVKKKLIKIKLPDSKTKKHKRNIPFLPELIKDMDTSKKFLFNDITDESSKQYFYKLYQDLGLNLSRHSTRHTFVSMCNHIKINPEITQEWVGHTTLKMTTDTYTHELVKGNSPILSYMRKLKQKNKDLLSK